MRPASKAVLSSCVAATSACGDLASRLIDALRAHTAADPMEHDDVSFYVAQIVEPPPGRRSGRS